jgi:hypothetical protein
MFPDMLGLRCGDGGDDRLLLLLLLVLPAFVPEPEAAAPLLDDVETEKRSV